MPNRQLIVVGASAGGVEALQIMLSQLPTDLPSAVMVVLHMPPTGGLSLVRILDRATDLEVVLADDGEPIKPGRVYVAPGDRHLLAGPGHVHVRKGPRENGHRPAVDPLFRSAAAYYGAQALGVILSGSLTDGTAGLYALKTRGGVAVVQNPADAMHSSMPASAIDHVAVDHVADAADMGPLLTRLAHEEVADGLAAPDGLLQEEVLAIETDGRVLDASHPGIPSAWPCPDCAGVLWEIHDGPIVRYRCRVGHAWSTETLLQEQARGIEGALWMALRALEDRAALSQRLAERAEEGGSRISAARHRDELAEMEKSINILRNLLDHDEVDAGSAGGVGS